MENEQKIKVALVRGDSLNEWEGRLWQDLDPSIEVVGFCSKKCLYSTQALSYQIKRLPTSTDSWLNNNLNKYLLGRFQVMTGLEDSLNGFDIAHTSELFYYYTKQAVLAKKNNPKLKVVATIWDNSFGRFEYNYWPGLHIPPAYWSRKINQIITEVVAGVDMFLPVTNYSAEMLKSYGVPESKIKILFPVLAKPLIADFSSEILQKLNLAGKEIYLMVNRLVKEKGVYDILYAWQHYCRVTYNASSKVLLMIGKGPERDNLHRLAVDLGLQKSIRFIDQLPNQEVRSLYPLAKALILASIPNSLWQEQFGFVLAESISAGCPVVTTYSGAIPEVIENAGLLCAPANSIALSQALTKLDNPEVYQQLKKNCQQLKNKFLPERFQKELISIYQQVISL